MNADPLARIYRTLEYAAFGRALQRARVTHIPAISKAKRILIAGEGDGRFLQRLRTFNPQASIDVFDSSAAMIAQARVRAAATFHHQDFLIAKLPPAAYDAAVTHFFLDCFSQSQVNEIAVRIRNALKPGALWLVSDFRPSILIPLLYRFFRLTTGLRAAQLPNYDAALEMAGLTKIDERISRQGQLTAQLWQKPTSSE